MEAESLSLVLDLVLNVMTEAFVHFPIKGKWRFARSHGRFLSDQSISNFAFLLTSFRHFECELFNGAFAASKS